MFSLVTDLVVALFWATSFFHLVRSIYNKIETQPPYALLPVLGLCAVSYGRTARTKWGQRRQALVDRRSRQSEAAAEGEAEGGKLPPAEETIEEMREVRMQVQSKRRRG